MQSQNEETWDHISAMKRSSTGWPEALRVQLKKNQKTNFLFLPSCCSGGVKHEICHLELLQKSTTCKKERKKNFLKIFFLQPFFLFLVRIWVKPRKTNFRTLDVGLPLIAAKVEEKNLRKVKFCWMRKKGRERGRKKKQQLQLLWPNSFSSCLSR